MTAAATHRHGSRVHSHDHAGPHRHLRFGLVRSEHERPGQSHKHGHSHGLVDRSILRSRAGVRAVLVSLAVLTVTALIQVVIFLLSSSVALLADLIHNFGDALTAVPLAIAFLLRRGESVGPATSSCS